MTEPSGRNRRVAVLALLAVMLFAATCSFRFLTLGGRLGGLDNDEFVVLAYSQELLMGDRPVRDYVEPGRPLQHGMLAASQWAFGPTLLPPIALSLAMLAAATVVLFFIAERASGSIGIATAIALIQIVMAPRFYNYPKVLAYAIGIPAVWWYMSRPGRGRLALVAVAGAIAFLLRHDHGAYMAVAGVAAVVLTHWPDVRRVVSEVAVLGLMAAALVAPYLLYASMHSGLADYVRASLEFGDRSVAATNLHGWPRPEIGVREPLLNWLPPPPPPQPHINARWQHGTSDAVRVAREDALGMLMDNPVAADTYNYKLAKWSKTDLQSILDEPLIASIEGINRTTLDTGPTVVSRRARVLDVLTRIRPLPGILNENNAIAFFFYVILLSPVLVLGLVAVRRNAFDDSGLTGSAMKLSVVAVLALAMLPGLVFRGNLQARFADVSEPIGVLVAALTGLLVRRHSRGQRVFARAAAVGVFVVALFSVQLLENVTLLIWQTGVDRGRAAVWTHARDVYRAYTANPPASAWDPREPGSVSVAAFVNRCTRADDRLLVVGYVPQLYVLSARGFANGSSWVLPDYYTSDDDQALMIERMRMHRVPVVFTAPEPDYSDDYASEFHQLDAYLRTNYQQVAVADPGTSYSLRVLVRRDLEPARSDAITGWPCFVS